ncbi:neuronal acetylcholine receptor subunit beta-3 [Biomphalaria glabrata]|nr:neuronal acetylcholine receptor subunit beta-3 [Biomphalaria glabrata]
MNTLDKRDVFADDMAPFLVKSSGLVMWAPGSLFTVSCELVMDNYPFDEHNCSIVMKSMTYTYNQLRFTNLQKPVITKYFSNTTEWDLKAIQFDIPTNLRADTNAEFSISMSLRRRPYFLLFNVVLPVVFLSFLNILVFAIPGNSGEKISYGITVLLALSVFLSTVGGMLPRTGTVPKLTTYLFTLLIISSLTVVDSIIIVFIHHMEEKEQQHQKAKSNFLRALNRFTAVRRVVSPGITSPKKQDLSEKTQGGHTDTPDSKKPNSDDSNGHLKGHSKNGYKVIGNHMDLVSFVVFLVIWLAVTINFVVNIATK